MTLNGAPGEVNNFLAGVDVRLPAFDTHQCGAYCGMPHVEHRHIQLARRILRRHSPWAPSEQAAPPITSLADPSLSTSSQLRAAGKDL